MTKDDLEQLALSRFQDSGLQYRYGPGFALNEVPMEMEIGGVKRGDLYQRVGCADAGSPTSPQTRSEEATTEESSEVGQGIAG